MTRGMAGYMHRLLQLRSMIRPLYVLRPHQGTTKLPPRSCDAGRWRLALLEGWPLLLEDIAQCGRPTELSVIETPSSPRSYRYPPLQSRRITQRRWKVVSRYSPQCEHSSTLRMSLLHTHTKFFADSNITCYSGRPSTFIQSTITLKCRSKFTRKLCSADSFYSTSIPWTTLQHHPDSSPPSHLPVDPGQL
ncbi:hypothetical protein BC629DRAFT_113891 [Irpex lacteus]|nr:hypothetical protein BC629DRAFT_113891 [Irpex lacteus]